MEHVKEEPRKRITARVSDDVRVTLEQAAELLGQPSTNSLSKRRIRKHSA